MVVAFNRVIAKQLEQDLGERLGAEQGTNQIPLVATVHALCVRMINEDVRLLLPHERECMIYDVIHEHPRLKQRHQGLFKASQALRDHEAGHADHVELWQACVHWLMRHRARLIGDVPQLVLDRLKGGDYAQYRYDYVIVDEFQDLTPAEQELVLRLRAARGQLVALGDPRQSIYRFRGNDAEGLNRLEQLTSVDGDTRILDAPMNECHRCPAQIVTAANRLMSLADARALVPTSRVAANLHVVTWRDPHAEARGMAAKIAANFAAHPADRHLVMVTRRKFGYWLRDHIFEIDRTVSVELSFSESLIDAWPVREAFLFFSLTVDPDPPAWRSWLGYKNSLTQTGHRAPQRNADAYLTLLSHVNDDITEETIGDLAAQPRNRQRGSGGSTMWDRARRYVDLRERSPDLDGTSPEAYVQTVFDDAKWIDPKYGDAETARYDMRELRRRVEDMLAKADPDHTASQRLRTVARELRYQIGTRESSVESTAEHLHVATPWGAKGITADHVYLLGVCDEALPGRRRPDYPGTETDYFEEQRRLFYVSITRTRKTLVLSRAMCIKTGEANQLGLAIPNNSRSWVSLKMSPFLRDINRHIPSAVPGESWSGC